MNTLADGNDDAPTAQAIAGCITAYGDAVVADVNIFNFGDYSAASKNQGCKPGDLRAVFVAMVDIGQTVLF